MKVTDVTVAIVEVPQKEPLAPYRSHVRSSSSTQSAIVRIDTDEGLTGWGEHNVNFLPDVSGRRMERDAREFLVGKNPEDIAGFHRTCSLETRLKSGIELALWDICGKAVGKPVCDLLGKRVRDKIHLAACMGIASYERAGELAAYYLEQGYGTLKTKAGSDMKEDLEMVRGIRDSVGDQLKLRIDPNMAYSREQSAELAQRLEEYDLEYLEQPLPDNSLADARWLREQTKTPIALNESVTNPSSVMEILKENAAAFVLPDTHIAGGIMPCVAIGRICETAKIPCIMHCGHDFGPKTAAMVHVAATCRSYSLANDSTYYGLEDDIVTEPLVIESGQIAVMNKPGLGIEGDPEKIERYKVDC